VVVMVLVLGIMNTVVVSGDDDDACGGGGGGTVMVHSCCYSPLLRAAKCRSRARSQWRAQKCGRGSKWP